eukprot:4048086-Amphidinium_carterae.1
MPGSAQPAVHPHSETKSCSHPVLRSSLTMLATRTKHKCVHYDFRHRVCSQSECKLGQTTA